MRTLLFAGEKRFCYVARDSLTRPAHRFTESIEESNFSSTIDLLANCAIFIYIGATMPFDAWNNELTTLTWWRLLLLCVGILALRRLPSIYALQHWIPDIKTRREAVFAGHFGPMGVGAIFIVRSFPLPLSQRSDADSARRAVHPRRLEAPDAAHPARKQR